MLLKLTIIFGMVALSLGATWQSYLQPIPKEFAGKEGCYIKEINEVVPFGKVVTPIGHCVRIGCGNMLFYASCGTVAAGDPTRYYVTKEDLSKPYPDCCPTIKRISDNNV